LLAYWNYYFDGEEMKKHYTGRLGYVKTACGLLAVSKAKANMTYRKYRVTCKNCLRTMRKK